MPFQIDNTLSRQENMLALVNTVTTYELTGDEFEFGNPTTYVPSGEDTSNTQVTLTSVPGEGFTGDITLYYRRLEIGNTKTAAATEFQMEIDDDVDSVKEKIALEHNLVVSEIDLVGDLPTPGGSNEVVTIEAITNSLLYYGSQSITLLAAEALPSFPSVRIVTDINEMQYASDYISFRAGTVGRGGSIDPASIGPGMVLSESNMLVTGSNAISACHGTENTFVVTPIVTEWEIVSAGEGEIAIGYFTSASYVNNEYHGGDLSQAFPSGIWYESDGQTSRGTSNSVADTYTTGDVIAILVKGGDTTFFKNGVFAATFPGSPNDARIAISFNQPQ